MIAQGYTLDLQGAAQKLQIRSWDAQLRMARPSTLLGKPDTWYTHEAAGRSSRRPSDPARQSLAP